MQRLYIEISTRKPDYIEFISQREKIENNNFSTFGIFYYMSTHTTWDPTVPSPQYLRIMYCLWHFMRFLSYLDHPATLAQP